MHRIAAGLLLCCLLSPSGCSVFKAAEHRDGTDLTVASKGVSRAEVEEILGAPETSVLTPDGEWTTSKYVRSKEGSGGRAVAHGVMDVLTLGLWEVVGTPIETVGDKKYGKIQVLYDAGTDKVIRTRQLAN